MVAQIQNGRLWLDGCDTVQLARQYGTPLYVYSQTDLTARMDQVRAQFLDRYPNTRAAYACKAFCTPALLKLVQRQGLCIDVVSGGELYAAMAAQFPPERIEFNGNNKQPDELEMAVDYGIGRVIVDGLQELALLEDICRRKGRRMKVLYRIAPGVKADSHDYIITGKKDSKFGLPLDQDILFPAIQAAIRSQWVDFLGLHFHLGSQLLDVAPYLQATRTALELMDQVHRRFGFTISELNVGGGFGITYTNEQRPELSYFMNPVMEQIEGFCRQRALPRPAVVIEPGRSIVGQAGITLYTVGAIKEIPGVRTYVSVDGGMTDNIRPALYQAVYRAVAANKADLPCDSTVTICGKCCESGDILLKDAHLPALQAGDILAFLSTGAYGYAMASHYNMAPTPAVVLAHRGDSHLIVRRQSYADLLATAQIPDCLKEEG